MLERVFRITCDFCETSHEYSNFGIPDKFRALRPNMERKSILHICEKCKTEHGISDKECLDKSGK